MRAVRSTKLLSFVATAALAGMLGAGCGGGGTSNPCEGIQNACPTEGIHKCSGDTGIQTCEKNADGCLVWSAATQCGDLQTCQATGSDAACRCSNQCPQAGDTQCKSGTDVIQTCTANSYGCLAWVDGTDCATENKYCDDSSEPAVCAESCSDRCTQGETRCNGDVVEGCATAASGCLDWIPGANCADNGQICSDASGTAGCYAPCTDACDTVDATRCQGEAVQTCRVGNDGCKAWVVSEDCSTNNQYCVESGGSASCAATCQDRCPADGDTRCADDETVQTCTTVASGCLDWQKTDECSLPRTKCQVSGGTAQCVEQCQDVCDPNIDDSQCNGTMRQGCQVVAETGCYDWVDLEDCASNGGFCDNSVNPVVCADHCTNECDTLDAKRCDPLGRVIQVCQAGSDGCNDWVTDTDCTANSQVCYDYNNGGSPKCIEPCESECSTAGATRCNNDDSAVETCELNTSNGCNYWNVTTTCAEPTPLCDDSSGDAQCVCTDLCDTAGATQCNGDVIQECAADGDQDSCLEWKDTTDCSQGGTSTDTCDVDNSGNAVCVCSDECQTGDTACNGDWVQTCVADGDDDDCLELADTTYCPDDGNEPTDTCGVDDNGDASCVCTDTCTPENSTQCDVGFEWIQTCTDGDSDGCLEWTNTTDCTQGGSSNDVCDDSGGSAQCVATCTNDCTEQELDTTRCGTDGTNDIVETCQVGGDGCRHWLLTDTCTDTTPACAVVDNTAQCVCVDECDTAGESCNGNIPEHCVVGADGCNDLTQDDACAADEVCEVYSGLSQCVVSCTEGLVDGSFEEVDSSSTWTATSSAWGTPMCDPNTCGNGTNLAFDGTWWIWVGGGQADVVDVSQQITIPQGRQATLFFLLWILPQTGNSNEITEVLIDSTSVWSVDTTDPQYYPTYKLVSVDLSAYADGAPHILHFHSVTVDASTSIFIDYAGLGIGSYLANSCCWNACMAEDVSMCSGVSGNEVWTCEVQTSGCLDWSVSQNCEDSSQVCGDADGTAACYDEETQCGDWDDNDNDAAFDCGDPTTCQNTAACTAGSGAAGSPCSAPTDCVASNGDPACLDSNFGDWDGYCSEWCSNDDACPAGSTCLGIGLPLGLCFDNCDASTDPCRSDTWTNAAGDADCHYECTSVGSGTSVCLPRCLPNSCQAVDLGTFDGTTTISLTDQDSCNNGTSYYSAPSGNSNCTGYSSNGSEIVYHLIVAAGETATVTITPHTGETQDSSLWVTTDCLDFDGASCFAGADETFSGDPETTQVDNSSGSSSMVVYIIADTYSGCGIFDITVAP